MKNCYQCRGTVKKICGSIAIKSVTIHDVIFEECQRCHERYFNLKTTAFIQEVTKFVKAEREKLLLK